MATTYKILGQVNPVALTATTLYTCPANTATILSTISVCNQGNTASFRISLQNNGAAISSNAYIVYDNFVNQYDSVFLTLGLTMDSADIVNVYASTGNVSFGAFGSEITA